MVSVSKFPEVYCSNSRLTHSFLTLKARWVNLLSLFSSFGFEVDIISLNFNIFGLK